MGFLQHQPQWAVEGMPVYCRSSMELHWVCGVGAGSLWFIHHCLPHWRVHRRLHSGPRAQPASFPYLHGQASHGHCPKARASQKVLSGVRAGNILCSCVLSSLQISHPDSFSCLFLQSQEVCLLHLHLFLSAPPWFTPLCSMDLP